MQFAVPCFDYIEMHNSNLDDLFSTIESKNLEYYI